MTRSADALALSGAGRAAPASLVSRINRRLRPYGLRLGSLDSDPGRRVDRHIFVSSKAPWLELRDGLPQQPGGAPFPELPGRRG